jgi:rubrerythrin
MDDRLIVRDGDGDTALVAEFERDRRDLLRRGLAVGGMTLAASSIPVLLGVRNAFAQASGDAEILESAIGLEQVAVFAYGAALDGGLLDRGFTRLATTFRDQEQAHADALISALGDLNGRPPAKPRSVADVDDVLKGLGDVRSQRDVAEFAVALETAAVAAYHDAQRKLGDAKLLQAAASIMANEGQHLVVLRQALGRVPVPDAFETGKPD